VFAADPAPYTLAGAFVLGASLGSLATIRVMRVVFGYVRPNNLIRGAKEPRPDPREGQDGAG